jgi:8-oxo-dGTP pyrophosphatase MutT (NUDIX family)
VPQGSGREGATPRKARFEFSAGGVVVRPHRAGHRWSGVTEATEVALAARRTHRGDLAWGLPKGLVEEGEDPAQTAVREVREETGLVAEIRAPLGDITYWYVWEGERVRKRVRFFLMDAVGGDVSQHDFEMEDVQWFPLEEAAGVASYRSERDVLQRAVEALSR